MATTVTAAADTATEKRTIRTVLHTYMFETRRPAEAAAWAAFKEKLKGHPRCMESHGGALHVSVSRALGAEHPYHPMGEPGPQPFQSIEVELDTDFLSDNQWNATGPNGKSARVFDWALDYDPGRSTGGSHYTRKQGHWLEQTEEMRAIRRDTFVCGYCGHQEPRATVGAFCSKCLTKGSEYLTPDRFALLRMLPVADSFNAKRAELTAAELADVMPRYIAAQLSNHDPAKAAAEIASGIKQAESAAKRAALLRAGWEFIAARKITTRNLICYDKGAGREALFTWGWMGDGMPQPVVEALAAQLADMPAPWEIVTRKGNALNGVKDQTIKGGGA